MHKNNHPGRYCCCHLWEIRSSNPTWERTKRPELLESGAKRECDRKGSWRGHGDQMPGPWKPMGSGLTLRWEANVGSPLERATPGALWGAVKKKAQKEGAQVGMAIVQARGDSREQWVGFWTFQKTELPRRTDLLEARGQRRIGEIPGFRREVDGPIQASFPTFWSHFYFSFCKIPYYTYCYHFSLLHCWPVS